MFDYRRTDTCNDLRKEHLGKQVTLSGWVNRRRDHGGLIFIDLRDRFGITQLVFDPEKKKEAHTIAESLRAEWVISIHGTVIERGAGLENPKMPTGQIEVLVTEIAVLSKAKNPPFSISDEHIEVNEELRLKYRYLDIRRGDIAKKLALRHKAMLACRNFLDSQGFLEITTPILGKSTPEGARDYLVPSRIHPGMFFALPQSPQLFKQLLMVAGMDKYFQIAQCFRDEDLRADRQPEFTQIDLEMSFGTRDDILKLVEGLLFTIFKTCKGIEIKTPFKHMPHAVAMEKYGTDRPDLRFQMELHCMDAIVRESEFTVFTNVLAQDGTVKALCVPNGSSLSRKEIEDYTAFVGHFGIKGLAWMKVTEEGLSSNIVKFFSNEIQAKIIKEMNALPGDLIFFIGDAKAVVNQGLDHLRRKIAKDLKLIPEGVFEFLWVTDFPLFSFDAEEGRLVSEHHPFTSPHPEDIHLLSKEPLKMRSSGYDIVLNGYEIGGGSQRIHDSALQESIFSTLKLTPEEIHQKFGFFIEALSFGTPPHLGLALGLDRLIMILSGTENIRDVIAFPKTQRASDLMMECPSEVIGKQLKELHLKVVK